MGANSPAARVHVVEAHLGNSLGKTQHGARLRVSLARREAVFPRLREVRRVETSANAHPDLEAAHEKEEE